MTRGIITVKEWFFDEVNDACKNYNCMLSGEYVEVNGISMLDHTKLRVDEVILETEEAYKVVLEAETFEGDYKGWQTWIPKSVICVDEEDAHAKNDKNSKREI